MIRPRLLPILGSAALLLALAGCESSDGMEVHGSVGMYYGGYGGYGYGSPWYYGPGYAPPVIVSPGPGGGYRPPGGAARPPAATRPMPVPARGMGGGGRR